MSLFYSAGLGGSVIPDPLANLIDGFEDGDLTAADGDWGSWGGGSNWNQIQQSTVLTGSFSAERVSAAGTGTRPIELTRSSPTSKTQFQWEWQIDVQDGQSNDTTDIFLRNSDTAVAGHIIRQNGDLADINRSNVGTWAANKKYRTTVTLDYPNNTYSLQIADVSDGSLIVDESDIAFANNASAIDEIYILLEKLNSNPSQWSLFGDEFRSET